MAFVSRHEAPSQLVDSQHEQKSLTPSLFPIPLQSNLRKAVPNMSLVVIQFFELALLQSML